MKEILLVLLTFVGSPGSKSQKQAAIFSLKPNLLRKRMHGNVFQDFEKCSPRKCVNECMRRPQCRSLNYDQLHLHCELNKYSSMGESEILEDANYVYKEMGEINYPDDPCKNNPCRNGFKCLTFVNDKSRCVFDRRHYDCSQQKKLNGIYYIRPKHSTGFDVYCEMERLGGGWIVIQKRYDGSVSFNRSCDEYQHGFGNLRTEFWLGNDRIHQITNQGNYELLIELEIFGGEQHYGRYGIFGISNAISNYRLTVGEYTGNFTDIMTDHNNQPFSCPSRATDSSGEEYCKLKDGGWWLGSCTDAVLNGQYYTHVYDEFHGGISWRDWYSTSWKSIRGTRMMIRKK